MGYPGDPVGSGGFFLPQSVILGLQLFRNPVNGSGQLGHETFFRNIHFFLFSQSFYPLDNRLYRTDNTGGSHCIDNNDKNQIKGQKFQDHIADIPDQVIIKSRPHQFKIPVFGKAQEKKIIPFGSHCSRIIPDISPDCPGYFSQGVMCWNVLGQVRTGPDHISCIILHQDPPGSRPFQHLLPFL